jgi:hypothetical protein
MLIMDVFGSTLSSKTNKLIADGNIKFENGLKKLDELISENRKKIASLIITADKLEYNIKLCDNLGGENYEKIENLIRTCDKFENKLILNDKAIGENREKIDNLNATSDIRIYVIETNVNKLLSTLSTLEGEIEKLTLRVNYLDVITLEDSTIATTQPTTRI